MIDHAIRAHLRVLYPDTDVTETLDALLALAGAHRRPRSARQVDERDVWLIAYGDHVIPTDGTRPLSALADLLEGPLHDVVGGVHLLPLYPSSSDDGFAVIDGDLIDPDIGTWEDVTRIGRSKRLMVDAVVNHVSAQSRHAREWTGHLLEVDESFDRSRVVRARTTPLVTTVVDDEGVTHRVWSTFSADQLDLDYSRPDVLVDVTAQLLRYLDRGASAIRLDAVGFLWKASGSSCIHLPETHEVVRLWRTLVDHCAPGALLVTETNVPHAENVTYLGDGSDEAHLVYQFALPPLLLAAFAWGNTQGLVRWAAGMPATPGATTFLNFLGSHDGIGMRPVENLLSAAEREGLCGLARRAGGSVSTYLDPAGKPRPYELNTTAIDALMTIADDGLGIPRVVAAHAVVLALQGVAGIWFGSLFGVTNWAAGVEQTGHARTINRRRVTASETLAITEQTDTTAGAIHAGIAQLSMLRQASSAFSPVSAQQVLPAPPWLIAIVRGEPGERVLVLVSVSPRDRALVPTTFGVGDTWVDELAEPGSRPYGDGDRLVLPPYGIAWLREVA